MQHPSVNKCPTHDHRRCIVLSPACGASFLPGGINPAPQEGTPIRCAGLHAASVRRDKGRMKAAAPFVDAHASFAGVHPASVDIHASSVGIPASPVGVHIPREDILPSRVGVHAPSVGIHASCVDIHAPHVDAHFSREGLLPARVEFPLSVLQSTR